MQRDSLSELSVTPTRQPRRADLAVLKLAPARASARPDGQPWSDRKRWVWWDEGQARWVGNDIPDFTPTKRPDAPAQNV